MAEINVQYINPFLQAAVLVIRDLCQMDMKIQKPYLRETDFNDESLIIMIGVTGEMRGQVFIDIKTSSAKTIASKMMMGMPVNELDDMAISAISELGNMIMGNAATFFSKNGVAIDITPPTLCRGNVSMKQSYIKNICIPLNSDEIKMELNIAVKED